MSLDKRSVQIDGKNYSYLFKGKEDGPIIILIHGVSGSAKDFMGIASALGSKGYGVVLPNLPGHMDSDYVDAQTFTDLAQWLNDFIHALNLKRPPVAIAGNSLAGAMCYEYAVHFGLDKKTKIFLVVPTPFIARLVKLFQDILVALPDRIVKYAYDKPVMNHLRVNYALVTKDKAIRRRVFESERRKEFLDVRILRYPVLLAKSNPFQRIRADEDLQRQIVLLCGEQDNVAGKRSLGMLRKLLPHSKMVIVPRTGHIMHFEAEDDYIHHLHNETILKNT